MQVSKYDMARGPTVESLGWSQGVVHLAAFALNLGDEVLPFLKFHVDEIDCLLQNNTLTAALTLQSRHQFCQPIEALSDGSAAFLFRSDVIVLLLLISQPGLLLLLARH